MEGDSSSDVPDDTNDEAFGSTFLKKRRKRTIIAAEQLLKLEGLYKQEQWPNREKKEKLARLIGMSTHFVNIWFQNKRSRMKKMAQEQEELSTLTVSNIVRNIPDSPLTPVTLPVHIAPKPRATKPLGSTSNDIAESSKSIPEIPRGMTTTSTCDTHKATSHKEQTWTYNGSTSVPTNNSTCMNGKRNLLQCIVAMTAVDEGGIVTVGDSSYDTAVNSALYGIQLETDSCVLVYSKEYGFDIHKNKDGF
ncbi:uncharacterized protein LOC102807594 [Saccoglossus kowalevskii]|uniref:Arginine-fifty homeobox-like n=1 Tax=Saccoglossus kowalevskii TaxID=10224 RepID=A0ABM0MW21_SACKO|nr:PREDICTED: arginine-fifty homeobox-like [Saccoglossus kowalevskii]